MGASGDTWISGWCGNLSILLLCCRTACKPTLAVASVRALQWLPSWFALLFWLASFVALRILTRCSKPSLNSAIQTRCRVTLLHQSRFLDSLVQVGLFLEQSWCRRLSVELFNCALVFVVGADVRRPWLCVVSQAIPWREAFKLELGVRASRRVLCRVILLCRSFPSCCLLPRQLLRCCVGDARREATCVIWCTFCFLRPGDA